VEAFRNARTLTAMELEIATELGDLTARLGQLGFQPLVVLVGSLEATTQPLPIV
jgi:hypothetical protein